MKRKKEKKLTESKVKKIVKAYAKHDKMDYERNVKKIVNKKMRSHDRIMHGVDSDK